MDKQQALEQLKKGNKRFMENNPAPKQNDAEHRQELTKGQQPYAVVITCSDSRVSPEIIFDASFNELFVIRNAGNVVTQVELASIEYAVEHLHTPLILVMGHEKCGAVKAACDQAAAGGDCEGNFTAIYDEILPSVQKNRGEHDEHALVEHDNALHGKAKVMESKIVSEMVSKGLVKVCCARYQIGSGEVEFFSE